MYLIHWPNRECQSPSHHPNTPYHSPSKVHNRGLVSAIEPHQPTIRFRLPTCSQAERRIRPSFYDAVFTDCDLIRWLSSLSSIPSFIRNRRWHANHHHIWWFWDCYPSFYNVHYFIHISLDLQPYVKSDSGSLPSTSINRLRFRSIIVSYHLLKKVLSIYV